MRHRLPPLSGLRLFEAAARLLSFRRAADELLLTPSAVSHGIHALEEWLQTPLFLRTSRGLQLTEAGAEFYPVVHQALTRLAEGSDAVLRRGGTRRLFISCAPTFAARWLVPRLGRFRERHPDIAIAIDTAHDRADVENGSVDLAIRMGRGGWQGLTANRLLEQEIVPVCAPSLHDRLTGVAEIENAPLIHVVKASEDWGFWAKAKGLPAPDPARGLCVDTIQMAMEAAMEGLGVALGRKPFLQRELQEGRLQEIWGPAIPCAVGYWLVGARSRAGDPSISAFRRWIVGEARSSSPRSTDGALSGVYLNPRA